MNNTTKMNPRLLGLTLAAALSFATNAAWAETTRYRFEADGPSGETLRIHLVDEATGDPVGDARVFAIHRQQLPIKGVPRFIDRQIALTPDGHGGFTYESNDVQTGVTIRLLARIGADASDIPGSVRVGEP